MAAIDEIKGLPLGELTGLLVTSGAVDAEYMCGLRPWDSVQEYLDYKEAVEADNIPENKTILVMQENGRPAEMWNNTEDGSFVLKFTSSGGAGERGPQGPQGNDGADGKSAYEIAKENGFVGTESEWLESLKGEKGADGAGISIAGSEETYNDIVRKHTSSNTTNGDAYLAKDTGLLYIYADGWPSQSEGVQFKGDKGDQGPTGPAGPAGYTPVKGVDYFDGEAGPQGPAGPEGPRGAAFTYADFSAAQLEALKGVKGDPFTYSDFSSEQLAGLKGPQGPQGPTGPEGPQGPQGPQGEKGADGTGISITGSEDNYNDIISKHASAINGQAYLAKDTGLLYIYADGWPMQSEGVQFKGDKGDTGPQGPQGPKGETGAAFTYEMFTSDQLANLKGPQGDRGPAFTYDDLTPEQKASLKGDKGDTGAAFTYADFTPAQLESLRGPQGAPFTYQMFTSEQLEALKVKGDKGDQGDQGPKGDPGVGLTEDMLDYLNSKLAYTYGYTYSISANPSSITFPSNTSSIKFTATFGVSKTNDTGNKDISLSSVTSSTSGWTKNGNTYEKTITVDPTQKSQSSGTITATVTNSDGKSGTATGSQKTVNYSKPWYVFEDNGSTLSNPVQVVEDLLSGTRANLKTDTASTNGSVTIATSKDYIWFAIPNTRVMGSVEQIAGLSMLESNTAKYTPTTSLGTYSIYRWVGDLAAGSLTFNLKIN